MGKTSSSPRAPRKAGIFLLTVLQLLPLGWGWISYALGSVTASLFTWLSFFSLLWYPVDWLCKHLWLGCEVMKQRLAGQPSDWQYAARCWDRHFPVF